MKLDQELEVKTAIEIQKEQEKQLKLTGSIIPHNNHMLFEIEQSNGKAEVRRAEYEMGEAKMVDGVLVLGNKKVIEKPGCTYISALNKKSALKKYYKGENGTRYDLSNTLNID